MLSCAGSALTNYHPLFIHGIRTPDFFWKTIITANPGGGLRAISWLIPNSATLGSLDSYIVSINELEDTLWRQHDWHHGTGPHQGYAACHHLASVEWL